MNPRAARLFVKSAYPLVFVLYVIVGVIAAHPFDDPVYVQHAQFFYYLAVNPSFNLSMGIYYDLINIAGYFPTVVLSLLGISNVLTIQIGVKSAFIFVTFLTAYFLYKIIDLMGYNGNYASLLLLTSPIYFFTSVIYGSALVVSVFFLVASTYFLFDRKNMASAVLMGMAIGSYLYPVFSIPFLLRYVNKEEGMKKTVIYLLVTAVFAAIGQFTVLYFYLKIGYHIGISPENPASYSSAMPVPYYSVYDIFNIAGISKNIPGEIYNYIYYSSALITSVSYFLLKKERVNRGSLLVFFLIQGILFASINPGNLPSYMSAMIPFAILLAIVNRRRILIGMIWISSALNFGVMQTINPTGFLLYFTDVNFKITHFKNLYPSWANDFLGFLYSLSLLFLIPIILTRKTGKGVRLKGSLIPQLSILVVLAIVALIILVPVSSSVPSEMYLQGEINTLQAQPISESLSGNSLVVEYSVPAVGFISESYLHYFIGSIVMPLQFQEIYNQAENTILPPGNFSESIQFNYPLRNNELELFGKENGTTRVEISNETSSLFPTSVASSVGSNTTFRYFINTTLSGIYEMRISSLIPLYGSNDSSPTFSLRGIPLMGSAMIGKYLLSGDYIPGYLLKSKLSIIFKGPFRDLPPYQPSLFVYPDQNLRSPLGLPLFEGGIAFLLIIILPSGVVIYQMRAQKQLRLW